MKKIISILAITGILFPLLAGCSSGDQKDESVEGCRSGSIVVQGEAPVFTSVATSREKAKEDACRMAITRCVGDEVSSQSGVADGQSIGSEIYSRSKGICKNGEILSEDFYNVGTIKMHRLQMRYQVATEVINDTIHTMQQMVGNPKIMVLIREEMFLAGQGKVVEGFSSRKSKAAAPLRDFLAAKGYTVVDGAGVIPALKMEELITTDPASVDESIKDRALEAGADVLIVGQVETHPQSIAMLQGSDFKSYSATGNIAILALWGQGKLIGEYSESAPGAQVNDIRASQVALQRFAVGADPDPIKHPDGLAKFVHSRLSSEWGDLTRNNVILMKINGVDSSLAGTFRDDLIERTAVKKVNEQGFENGSTVWEVVYPGRAFALADTLSFYSDDPRIFFAVRDSGKKIHLDRVKRGEIEITFQ